MAMTTDAPARLYLLELAVGQGNDVPMPGYLIQMRGGANVLVDTGWPIRERRRDR